MSHTAISVVYLATKSLLSFNPYIKQHYFAEEADKQLMLLMFLQYEIFTVL